MKKAITLLSFILICTMAFAQGKIEEVVYLKNGSIIHGMIVEYVPNVSIKIKSGANLFAYKLDEIEKITREESAGGAGGGGYDAKVKGYYGIAQVGLTDFPAGGNLPMASIVIINGYQFNRIFSMGAGVGADISTVNVYNVPVFMDLRANFMKTRVTPFFAMGIGYNAQIRTSSDYFTGNSVHVDHGLIVNPSFGVKGHINKRLALSLALGYKMLAVNYRTDDGYGDINSNFGIMHGLTLLAGFHF